MAPSSGTLAYMSPEQASGAAVDARSDVFSFGAMLYEMVTGQRAFARKTAEDTLAAVVRDNPKPLREVMPGISETLERIIVRCLKKEPDRRFQHMRRCARGAAGAEGNIRLRAPRGCGCENPPEHRYATPRDRGGNRRGDPRCRCCCRGALARVATYCSVDRHRYADPRAAHIGAASRQRKFLPRWDADRLRLRGGGWEQLGCVVEDRRPGRSPTSHGRPRS